MSLYKGLSLVIAPSVVIEQKSIAISSFPSYYIAKLRHEILKREVELRKGYGYEMGCVQTT